MIRIVGTNCPNLLAIRVVQIELGAAGNGGPATGHTTEGGHGVLDAVGRVVIVVVPADADVAFCELVEAIALGTDLHLLWDRDVTNILEAGCCEKVADLVIAVVEDDPFYQGGGVCLGLEHLDCRGNELAAIVRGREDTDCGAGHLEGRRLLLCWDAALTHLW